jgi:hypothetical protein
MTMFGTLHPDGTVTDQREIRQSDIGRCPHLILLPDHYRADGSCRCDDADHTEMGDWGYKWDGESWR